jgi:adenine-specific DNA-methyltransferase
MQRASEIQATFLENAIIQLDSLDKISRLQNAQTSSAPKIFRNGFSMLALELSITWINRILFLKLLEAQLITYHRGDKSYEFLNTEKVQNFDALNKPVFPGFGATFRAHTKMVKKAFEKVPYLNSSLFEPSEIEHQTLFISNLGRRL